MEKLFFTVLSMSLTASYVILVVILIRLLLKKAPKIISYALWSVVAFRLVFPFSFESRYSLIPRNTVEITVRHDMTYQSSQIDSVTETVESAITTPLAAPTTDLVAEPLLSYVDIAVFIWITGITVLLVYSIGSVLLLKRRLVNAKHIGNDIFEAENLKTPFVFGIIKPKIYLPAGLGNEEQSYIIMHEKTHIRRKDHIIKIMAFIILSVHWFNPIVWIAFILMSTDMELSCDEKVLKEMDENIKKPYASTLLSLAAGRYILNGSPLAFGEGNVK